jgi:hypothetical protein
MNWTTFRSLGWLSIVNGTVALICGKAAWKAFGYRDVLIGACFSCIAVGCIFGLLLGFFRKHLARRLNRRFGAGGIYLAAAFTTWATVDDLMFMATESGHPYSGWSRVLIFVSLTGCAVLAFAALATFIQPRFGYIAALIGTGLLLPYFALAVWNVQWRDFVWFVRIHWDGELQVSSVLSISIAIVYLIVHIRRRFSSHKMFFPDSSSR